MSDFFNLDRVLTKLRENHSLIHPLLFNSNSTTPDIFYMDMSTTSFTKKIKTNKNVIPRKRQIVSLVIAN